MLFALIRYIKTIRLFQWTLFVWVDIYVAFDAFLSHIGPTVSTHPFALAFGALVFPEASLFTLIRRQAFDLWIRLGTVFDVVAFIETQMTEIVQRRSFRHARVS